MNGKMSKHAVNLIIIGAIVALSGLAYDTYQRAQKQHHFDAQCANKNGVALKDSRGYFVACIKRESLIELDDK